MELKNFFVQDDQGNKLPGAQCYLYLRGTESPASGAVKANGAPLEIPFTADNDGLVQFAAPNGIYDIRVVTGSRDFRIRLQFNDVNDVIEVVQSAAAQAETARDTFNLNIGRKADIEEGLRDTVTGQSFTVLAPGANEYIIEYKNSAGTAVEVKTYPSATAVSAVRDGQREHLSDLDSTGLRAYTGDGDIWPLMADAEGRVLLGYDRIKGEVVGKGIAIKSELNDAIYLLGGENGEAQYTGLGPVWPFLTDALGRVLLGYDQGAKKLVGAFPSVAQPVQVQQFEQLKPLPAGTEPVAKDINHFLFYGQSLSVGAAGGPVLSTAQPYSNITFNGGPRAAAGDYSAFKPLVEDAISPAPDGGGNRSETPCSGAANYAVELAAMEGGVQPSSHVVLASTAGHGGYSIDQLKKGTAWYQKVIDHVTAAKTLATTAAKSYAVHAFTWIQGETDTDQNTKTQPAYRDLLSQLQRDVEADAMAISGQDRPVPCVTYQVTYGVVKTPNMALAQLELAQTNSRFFLATPCYHLPFASDKTHLTAAGYKWLGHYFGRAYKRLVMDGAKPQFINPVSAVCRGTVLSIRFKVPVTPLVLDAATLAATTDHGFKVQDETGALTLTSIRVVNGNTVQATLNRVLGANPTARYGLDYLGIGLAILNGASGNLRDSESASVSIGGVSRPLYNVCPHFQLPIISLA